MVRDAKRGQPASAVSFVLKKFTTACAFKSGGLPPFRHVIVDFVQQPCRRRHFGWRRLVPLVFGCVACLSFGPGATAEAGSNAPRRVVLVVCDGLRPDIVDAENTPALWKLSREGVIFRNHHAVYPSVTHVNGATLVTGVYPGRSGVTANIDYRPDIDPGKPVSTEQPSVVRRGDEVSDGKYIGAATLPELIRAAGQRTVVAGTKGVAFLLDRRLGGSEMERGVMLCAGATVPEAALAPIAAALGRFPSDRVQQDIWTTKALTEFLWKVEVPAFSIVWLGQPDLAQHEAAPSAPIALAAIRSADNNLAAIIRALDEKGVRESTDILVVSDHGFSTIERAVDLRKILNDAGFTAVTPIAGEPKNGAIMLVGNGGTVLFYVIGHDLAVTRRLVEFLQQSDFAGPIFTREPLEGTFGFQNACIETAHEPDVEMSFRWSVAKNRFGALGMIQADWNRRAGQGTHGTLSRFDMHNTLIAAGPDFRRGEVDELPTGNVDVAPTVLHILGIKSSGQLDGRVLLEALDSEGINSPLAKAEVIKAARDFPAGTWHQSLQFSRVGSTTYIDQGEGVFVPKK